MPTGHQRLGLVPSGNSITGNWFTPWQQFRNWTIILFTPCQIQTVKVDVNYDRARLLTRSCTIVEAIVHDRTGILYDRTGSVPRSCTIVRFFGSVFRKHIICKSYMRNFIQSFGQVLRMPTKLKIDYRIHKLY